MTEGRIVAVSSELYREIQRGSGVVDDTRPCHFEGHDRPEDAELAPTPERLRHTCGTYVIDLSGAELETSLSILLKLADNLEADHHAAEAQTGGEPPLSTMRRWNLHDPYSERNEVELNDSNTGLQLLLAGSMTRPGWVVPNRVAAADVPIQRQRPDDFTALSDPGRW